MTTRLGVTLRSVALACLLLGCGGDSPTRPVQLAVFADPAGGFSTSDVRDVDGEIVRLDTASGALIWAASGASFPGFPVSGHFIGTSREFQVRFGSENGQRRAWFTETASAFICDISAPGGQLTIRPTTVPVPP